MTNQDDFVEIVPVDSGIAIFNQEKAMIDIQISTAKAYPRSIRAATENIVAIATMDRATAESCNYALPRGGKHISGPSVHLARIIAQQWGNIRVDSRVVGVDATHVTAEAVCFDLETNVAVKTQVKRSIVGKSGRFNDDMITVTGNAACAIALRNAVYSVVPKSVIEKAYKAAMSVITGDISDETKLIAKRKQVLDALKDAYKVTDEEILKAIGKSSLAHIGAEEIVTLIGFGQAIKDGDATVDGVFRPSKGKGDESYTDLFGSTNPPVESEPKRKSGK